MSRFEDRVCEIELAHMSPHCSLCQQDHDPMEHIVSVELIRVERCRICGGAIIDAEGDRAGLEPLPRSCLDNLDEFASERVQP